MPDIVRLVPVVFGAEADGGLAAAFDGVVLNQAVVGFGENAARARAAEPAADNLVARPVPARVVQLGPDRDAEVSIQRRGPCPVAVVFEGSDDRLAEKAVLIRDARGLADHQPPIPFQRQRGTGDPLDSREAAVDGDAVIQEDALEDAVFDVRAGTGPSRVQAVGGIGDERVLSRPGGARA